MLIYGVTLDRNGERNWMDTEDFQYVFFQKETFSYIENNREIRVAIEFKLTHEDETIQLKGELINSDIESVHLVNLDTDTLYVQGEECYHNQQILDDAPIIKSAKESIIVAITTNLMQQGHILKGTKLDVMGLVKNDGNTIGVVDNVTIESESMLKIDMHYAIVNLSTLSNGQIEIYLGNNRKIVADINRISGQSNTALSIELNSFNVIDTQETIEHKKSIEFDNVDDYYADRAKYINVSSSKKNQFDDLDDLF